MTERAYVLMTALPPTKGHQHLIEFAAEVGRTVEVVLCTQPDEPYAQERYDALRQYTINHRTTVPVNIHWIHQDLPQEPEEAVGFWDMWAGFLQSFGITPGDYIVASEKYGIKLAEITGARFMPYDMSRSIFFTKATLVRDQPRKMFSDILPEFQPVLRKTITIFGAESTGKTTLSKRMTGALNGYWACEWARPYLETVGNDINDESMTAIWKGQLALQRQVAKMDDRPFIFQDTDLFTTLGYWNHSIWAKTEGKRAPEGLVRDALATKSDLYLITKSNIPFEPDSLRYGVDRREISDETWIEVAEKYNLNYVVLEGDNMIDRQNEAYRLSVDIFNDQSVRYQRVGEEYATIPTLPPTPTDREVCH